LNQNHSLRAQVNQSQISAFTYNQAAFKQGSNAQASSGIP